MIFLNHYRYVIRGQFVENESIHTNFKLYSCTGTVFFNTDTKIKIDLPVLYDNRTKHFLSLIATAVAQVFYCN